MAFLSLGCGATAAAIGPSQSLCGGFVPSRGKKKEGGGGGGNTPPRFFPKRYGEQSFIRMIRLLPPDIVSQILTPSQFSKAPRDGHSWEKWESKKHLVNVIGKMVERIAETDNPRASAVAALSVLDTAASLHEKIRNPPHLGLTSHSGDYQATWAKSLRKIMESMQDDYDYLNSISAIRGYRGSVLTNDDFPIPRRADSPPPLIRD